MSTLPQDTLKVEPKRNIKGANYVTDITVTIDFINKIKSSKNSKKIIWF